MSFDEANFCCLYMNMNANVSINSCCWCLLFVVVVLLISLFFACYCFFVCFFGEFDPGSGRTLAACLTHASRTERPLPLVGVLEWRTGE